MPQNVGSIEDLITEPVPGKPSTSAIQESNFHSRTDSRLYFPVDFFPLPTSNLYTKELKFQVLSLIL